MKGYLTNSYRKLANFIDINSNTSSRRGKQRHELSTGNKNQRQEDEYPETMTNNPQVTTDLLVLGESCANVCDLRGEAECEVVETESL